MAPVGGRRSRLRGRWARPLVATGDVRMCGVLAEIDPDTGQCLSIERIEVAGANADQAFDADDAKGAGEYGG